MHKQRQNFSSLLFLITIGISLFCSCSSTKIPEKWDVLKITNKGLIEIEKETDENGLYLKFEGISRNDLLKNVKESLNAANYEEIGDAFEGRVIGFTNGEENLAVKIDQFDKTLYLAIFNENGKEPLLHRVVFGKYNVNRIASGEKAREMLNDELKE
jgi:hypothetical protein